MGEGGVRAAITHATTSQHRPACKFDSAGRESKLFLHLDADEIMHTESLNVDATWLAVPDNNRGVHIPRYETAVAKLRVGAQYPIQTQLGNGIGRHTHVT